MDGPPGANAANGAAAPQTSVSQAPYPTSLGLAGHAGLYIGGDYVDETQSSVSGQMYVDKFWMSSEQHLSPVVLLHGDHHTGAVRSSHFIPRQR